MLVLCSYLTPSDIDILMVLYPDIPSSGVPFGRSGNKRFLEVGWQYRRAAALIGDATIIGPTRLMSRLLSTVGDSNVYKYRFNATDPTKPSPEYRGAAHLLELNYVWNNPALRAASTEASRLVDVISKMLISFIVDQDPNGHGLAGVPVWKKYSTSPEGENIVFELGALYTEADNWRKQGIDKLITARSSV
jgi:carboxylesterase type B